MAVYPNSIFPWTARRNNLDVVWANDPNSIVAEVQAIESIIGTNPNIETGTYNGVPLIFSTMNARVAAAATLQNMPFAVLANTGTTTIAPNKTMRFSYTVVADQYAMWNGIDITIPASGLYYVFANVDWDTKGVFASGVSRQTLIVNGKGVNSDFHVWNYPSEQVWQVLGFDAHTQHSWMGGFTKGDVVTIGIGNATNCTMTIDYASLRTFMVRQFSPGVPFQTG